jgi:uncharacterized SAM-binding protein YcdF (DUF218 family)
MLGFLYSVLLKLLYPTSVAIVLLIAAALVRRAALRRLFYLVALAVLLICGNGCVVRSLVLHLEAMHPAPDPVPSADTILVLSGGIHAKTPPRPTVEVSEAGDRVLYGAELYRRGKAPQIICTGDLGTGAIGPRPEAEDMAELLRMIGISDSAIVLETKAQNTHEHAVNLCPIFEERKIQRVLLVTTAMHMPRSIGVFRHSCPAVEEGKRGRKTERKTERPPAGGRVPGSENGSSVTQTPL